MALRKGKIVEAARVQSSGGAGEKEEVLGIRTEEIEIPLCTPAPLQFLRCLIFSLTYCHSSISLEIPYSVKVGVVFCDYLKKDTSSFWYGNINCF